MIIDVNCNYSHQYPDAFKKEEQKHIGITVRSYICTIYQLWQTWQVPPSFSLCLIRQEFKELTAVALGHHDLNVIDSKGCNTSVILDFRIMG